MWNEQFTFPAPMILERQMFPEHFFRINELEAEFKNILTNFLRPLGAVFTTFHILRILRIGPISLCV